jgi:colanic acid biosynthesis glycosyl transferase WcaI
MRILINDFGGYAFIFQLSQKLAEEGHDVIHVYLKSLQTPQGNLISQNRLQVIPILLDEKFNKYSFTKRIIDERSYAKSVNKIIDNINPQVVISANTPLIAQFLIQQKCLAKKYPFIFWCQDIHSVAIKDILKKKIGNTTAFIGYFIFKKLEVFLLKRSSLVISIASSFSEHLMSWGIEREKIILIPNWSSFSSCEVHDKSNDWSKKNNISDSFCITYTGTLGFKHNPEIFILLAEKLKIYPNIKIVIVSEGMGASYINEKIVKNNISNLLVFPYQSFDQLPLVFASSDLLICTLENSASLYSVPSKVSTYLSVGKPIVCYMNPLNLSAKIVHESGAGEVIPIGDIDQLVSKIERLYKDDQLRYVMGKSGIEYANKYYNINNVYKVMETIFARY